MTCNPKKWCVSIGQYLADSHRQSERKVKTVEPLRIAQRLSCGGARSAHSFTALASVFGIKNLDKGGSLAPSGEPRPSGAPTLIKKSA